MLGGKGNSQLATTKLPSTTARPTRPRPPPYTVSLRSLLDNASRLAMRHHQHLVCLRCARSTNGNLAVGHFKSSHVWHVHGLGCTRHDLKGALGDRPHREDERLKRLA